jgi:hypothetical protein
MKAIVTLFAATLSLVGCANNTTSHKVVSSNIEAVAINVGIPQAKAVFCAEATVTFTTQGGEETVSSKAFQAFIRKQIERACYDIAWKNSTNRLAAIASSSNMTQIVEQHVLDYLNTVVVVPKDAMAKRYAVATQGFEIRNPIEVQKVSMSQVVITSDFDYHESEVVFSVIGKERAFEYGVFVRKPGVLTEAQLADLRERVAAIDVTDIAGHNFSKVGTRIKETCSAFLDNVGVKTIVTQHSDHVIKE